MDVDARVEAWASLHLVRGLTTRAGFDLLKAFGGPIEILAAGRASLMRFVSGELADDIRRGGDPRIHRLSFSMKAASSSSLDRDSPSSAAAMRRRAASSTRRPSPPRCRMPASRS